MPKHFDWQGTAMGTSFNDYVKNARKREKTFELSKTEFMEICVKPCHYCGIKPSGKITKKYEIDKSAKWGVRERLFGQWNGIDRRDNDKNYTLENSVPCCWQCNDAKGKLTEKDFSALCWRICLHQNRISTANLKID